MGTRRAEARATLVRRESLRVIYTYFLQFLKGAQLARIVNPRTPRRHINFVNLRGKENTFLLEPRTHFLFVVADLQQFFILAIGT